MFKKQTDNRVAVFFADGCEEIEGLTVVDLLFRAGIPCDMVSVSGSYQVTSSHEVTFLCNKLISEVDINAYAMLVLPGGIPGTPNLAATDVLMQAVDTFAAQGKPLAAICAAPSIYAERGTSQRCSSYCQSRISACFSGEGCASLKRPCGSGWSVHYQPRRRYRRGVWP